MNLRLQDYGQQPSKRYLGELSRNLLYKIKVEVRATLDSVPKMPPDHWFVVRGGVFAEPANLFQTVCDSIEDGYGATASVHAGCADETESFDSALKRVCILGELQNGKVRLTSVGRLRKAGFEVVSDISDGQPICHHNVVFTEPPNIEQARLFIECFDPPIPNPAKD